MHNLSTKTTHKLVASTEKLSSNRFVGIVLAQITRRYSTGYTSTHLVELARLYPFTSDDTARKYAKEELEVWRRRRWYNRDLNVGLGA